MLYKLNFCIKKVTKEFGRVHIGLTSSSAEVICPDLVGVWPKHHLHTVDMSFCKVHDVAVISDVRHVTGQKY